MSSAGLPTRQLAAYASSALPFALLSLPVYLHIPKFYGETFGLDLATLGGLLLCARLFDAVLDPLLGHLSDTAQLHGIPRLRWFWLGTPLLVVGIYLMFVPRASDAAAGAWLVGSSLIVYSALSLLQINYHAHGAELTSATHERTRVTAWRESFTLFGILLGAAVPVVFAANAPPREAFAQFALVACGVLAVASLATIFGSPAAMPMPHAKRPLRWRDLWSVLVDDAAFRRLLLVYLCNGTAAAIPATLALFFVEDVLGRGDLTPHFLITYFAAGACGMPLWPRLAASYGKSRLWSWTMLAAVGAFVWAGTLHNGAIVPFFAISVLSGLVLGADLALPPALLADLIERGATTASGLRSGSYFGIWALATKLTLALAAGIALPLVALLGYVPGTSHTAAGLTALAWCYAGLPCGLKLVAFCLLRRLPTLAHPETNGPTSRPPKRQALG